MASSEHDIAHAIVRYLNTLDARSATIAEIHQDLPEFINLDAEDLRPSDPRDPEPMWYQKPRNIVCHRHSRGNAVYEGLLVYRAPATLALPAPQ